MHAFMLALWVPMKKIKTCKMLYFALRKPHVDLVYYKERNDFPYVI